MSAKRDWPLKELTQMYDRRYRLRKCAVEFYFKDDTSWLFQFFEESVRNRVFDAILQCKPPHLLRTASIRNPCQVIETTKIHLKWCRREISNFDYLMRLNILAGRTFNDLTQYPTTSPVSFYFKHHAIDLTKIVFFFLIKKKGQINLTDTSIYRDLTKPVGALNPDRLQKFIERYESMVEATDANDPKNPNNFMYGSHYSSIGIVLYYLIRMEPFTTCNKIMQGGKFDHPDRLFDSIADCFEGCYYNSSDVKELIPEFYYLPEFLINRNKLDFGKKQNGEAISDVKLPLWANGSTRTFVEFGLKTHSFLVMRQALESEYVSENLHHWIDLIFGYKQRLPEAQKWNNLFHPYTYEGNVDIDAIADETHKKAILEQIDSFGQTPSQLFFKPHPRRLTKEEVVGSIFAAKCVCLFLFIEKIKGNWIIVDALVFITNENREVKYYGKHNLCESEGSEIIAMRFIDKNKEIITVHNDCTVITHVWKRENLRIEKKKTLALFNIARRKKTLKIGNKFSNLIDNPHVCTAIDESGLYVFACGFDNLALVVWDIAKGEVVQTLQRHTQLISCLALDEDSDRDYRLLVTGSYDTTVIVWRLLPRHGISSSLRRTSTEIIDSEPRFILTGQSAKVGGCTSISTTYFFFFITCVDVSIQSGIIVCCDISGEVNIYNASTGDHLDKFKPSSNPRQLIADEQPNHPVSHYLSQNGTNSAVITPVSESQTTNEATNGMDQIDHFTPDPNQQEKENTNAELVKETEENVKEDEEDAEVKEDDIGIEEGDKKDEEKAVNGENATNVTDNVSEKAKSLLDINQISPGLNIVRVSSLGDIVCYSKQLKYLWVYSCNGELMITRNVRGDLLSVMEFNKDGTFILTGGNAAVTLIRDTKTLTVQKQFSESKEAINCVTLDKDEAVMFVAVAGGDVLIYSLAMNRFLNNQVFNLDRLGF
ncbi:hypothetical protein RFI_22097 [Reticulomyxa filosa]|uniref:BEACH domain-containing protein n=1 Tax=Reticulomyxa filosa TaxID=46433 RepID=X6MNM2_RETFI|nr:hypothetical protein RFI_22097 [Reticulomyxa filosa]|eukprot:ETO15266.1 hypothetical protein RFI_22097 [Reticulomyxa filosa]